MLGDYLASNVAWFLFNIVRFHFPGIQAGGSLKAYLLSSRVIEGQIIFPLLMMAVLQQFELEGIWFVIPSAAFCTAAVAFIIYLIRIRKSLRLD